jgi:phosphohistidine phosphatase
MELYVLRHAIAVERGTRGYKDDGKRPLTEEGAMKMRRIAEGMRALDLSFEAILSSPFIRARQTAEIVAEYFDAKKQLTFTPHLEVGGDPEELIMSIDEQYRSDAGIMLVGHEPYLSSLISMLIAGRKDISITMKKGGLSKLRVSKLLYGQCASLEWLLTPRQLALLR